MLSTAGLAACGHTSVPADAVAIVNGAPITRSEFNEELAIASASQQQRARPSSRNVQAPPTPPQFRSCISQARSGERGGPHHSLLSESSLRSRCKDIYDHLRSAAMNFIVRGAWIVEEAKSLGIRAGTAAVDARYSQVKARQFPQPAAFAAFLKASGETVSELHYRVMLELLREKVEARVQAEAPKPTAAAVVRYFNTSGNRFATAPQRGVRLIYTATRVGALMAKALLTSGEAFAVVAERYSTGAAPVNGGGLIKIKRETQSPALDAAVFGAPTGRVGGPIKTPLGYALFEVAKIYPQQRQSLSEATPAIREVLTSANQERQLAAFDARFASHWRSRTVCDAAFFEAELCGSSS